MKDFTANLSHYFIINGERIYFFSLQFFPQIFKCFNICKSPCKFLFAD